MALQSLRSSLFPVQAFLFTPEQTLRLDLFPLPQVFEHSVHDPHVDHSKSNVICLENHSTKFSSPIWSLRVEIQCSSRGRLRI